VAPQPTPDSEQALLYAIRDAGVVVDLAHKPAWAPHPETHALDLLYMPMGDEDFAGQPATEKVIKKY
jgi:hypothetical protein